MPSKKFVKGGDRTPRKKIAAEKVVKSLSCPAERSAPGVEHEVVLTSDRQLSRKGNEEGAYRCSCGKGWWRLLVPKAESLLRFAVDVCQAYEKKGYLITLRQLYYQGVARGFLPSGDDAYDALMVAVSKARLAGTFPLWALVDRTRKVYPGRTTRCDTKVDRALVRAAEAVQKLPEQLLHRDPWFGQPFHVSVWFEKEALAGIFEAVCEENHVSWFSCRGDPSHPSLYQWLQTAALAHGVDNPTGWKDKAENNHKGMARKSVILYFGDHDPTGIRIPQTAEETLRTFMRIMGLDFEVEFRRVGITMAQARAMDLPSFTAKKSAGSDYDAYVEKFGTDEAWELDALPPEMLEAEVRREVRALFDEAQFKKLQADVEQRRDEMRRGMRELAWHKAATAKEES
jgi:hypothetical protein